MKTIQVIYLESETCGVCHALQPRVEEVTEQEGVALEVINVTQHPEVASQYQVLTVPVAIVFVGDKEFARQARFIDIELFEKTTTTIERICSNGRLFIVILETVFIL